MSNIVLFIKNKTIDLFSKAIYFKQDTLINKGIPFIASASYVLQSSKFLAPNLFSSICGESSLKLSNALLINSVFGNMLYIFSSNHMRNAKLQHALGYSAFASVMFNFGSILLWSFTKNYLPENEPILFTYGILSSFALLFTAKYYLDYLDTLNEAN